MEKDFNVFICYRGKEDGDGRTGSDGKPIALDIYSELNKYSDINAFFAPKEYEAHHDFVDDIPKILKSIKVAILVLTTDFFQPFSCSDDVVKRELDSLLEKNIPIIPVFEKDYNMLNDDALISKYYSNEQKNKIMHIVGVAYNGIYDFRGDKLYNSIRKIMDCNINGIDATSYNFDSILFQIGFIEDSSSVTVALSKIIDFLEDKLLHTADIDMKQLLVDTDECIDKICEKVPHFSALKIIWQETLKKILKRPQDAAREALHSFKRKKQDIMDKIATQAKSIIKEGDGILTFSQSQSVIDLLLSIHIPIKCRKSSTIYISEGRSKCHKPFVDAIEIYKKLENADYKQKIIITDCSIYQLMLDKKITKVILGACSVELKNGKLVNFVNSAGTSVILMLAEKFNIPVYIISESTKFLLDFNNRELQLSIQELKKEFGDDIDAIDYVKLSRSPNVSFISENGNDIKSLATYFWDDLNKDRRVISIYDGNFVKSCDKTEYEIECAIYSGLQDQQI